MTRFALLAVLALSACHETVMQCEPSSPAFETEHIRCREVSLCLSETIKPIGKDRLNGVFLGIDHDDDGEFSYWECTSEDCSVDQEELADIICDEV